MESSETVQLQDTFARYYPFLLEIRKRLLFVACLLLVGGAIGFIYYTKVVTLALKVFNLEGVNIVFTSPFQYINLAISSGLFVGSLVVLPLFIFQVLSFLRPALSKREFSTLLFFLPLSIFLFICGFTTGIMVMKYVVVIFYQKSQELNIGNLLDISQLLSQILTTSVLMGIAYQFPLVLSALMRTGVLNYHKVKKQRYIAFGGAVGFAALLPPTDLLSLFLLAAPLVVLYELTLLANRPLARKHSV